MIPKNFAANILNTFIITAVYNIGTLSERADKNDELRRTNLATGITDVGELIRGGYVYVDKTHFVLKLIKEPETYFFLARPKGFGKTTFVSTLAEIFKNGSRDLFEGTAIYRSDYKWPKHPVVRIDFSEQITVECPDKFENSTIDLLKEVGASYGISDLQGTSVKNIVADLISELHEKFSARIVLLIDEYDFPYAKNYRKQPDIAEKNVQIMNAFYSAVKSVDSSVELCFVTGVTKLVQSGLDTWMDISVEPEYAEIAGFTQKEVECNFADCIEDIVKKKNTTRENILRELRMWYEGYRFSSDKIPVYNSYTIISYFISKETRDFWTRSDDSPKKLGLVEKIARYPDLTLSYLHRGMKQHPRRYIFGNLFNTEDDDEGLNKLETVMLQAGYLTIKKYDPKRDTFKLGLANREIREAVFSYLLDGFGERKYDELLQIVTGLKEDLENLNLGTFVDKINTYIATFLANSTNDEDKLSSNLLHAGKLITNDIMQVIFQTALIVARIKINPPYGVTAMTTNKPTPISPIDFLTLFIGKILYLFELRLSEDPLEECIWKYNETHETYHSKRAVCVGVKFDTKTTRIINWEAAEFSEMGKELRRMYSTNLK